MRGGEREGRKEWREKQWHGGENEERRAASWRTEDDSAVAVRVSGEMIWERK